MAAANVGRKAESDPASRSRNVRRMDSLARLVHTNATEPATAVGFRKGSGAKDAPPMEVAVAHNVRQKQGAVLPADQERLDAVQQVLTGASSARKMAKALAADSPFTEARLRRDLRKLRSTFTKGDESTAEVHANMQATFGQHKQVPVRDLSQGTLYDGAVVHAESALLVDDKVSKSVGVSKLSCQDCFDNGRKLKKDGSLRGTHGMVFPGTGQTTHAQHNGAFLRFGARKKVPDKQKDVSQYPEDSASEDEGSDVESK